MCEQTDLRGVVNDAHADLTETLHLIEAFEHLGEMSDEPILSGFDVAKLMRALRPRVLRVLKALE